MGQRRESGGEVEKGMKSIYRVKRKERNLERKGDLDMKERRNR